MTSRLAPIRDWLGARAAVCLWQQAVPRVGLLSAYTVRGCLVYVMAYGDVDTPDGWEAFIPAELSGGVEATLTALDRFVGAQS
jgi:hypothetical protein